MPGTILTPGTPEHDAALARAHAMAAREKEAADE